MSSSPEHTSSPLATSKPSPEKLTSKKSSTSIRRSSTGHHLAGDEAGTLEGRKHLRTSGRSTVGEARSSSEHDAIRRSILGPEFLQEFAKKGTSTPYDKDGKGKFKVVTGDEAASIYEEYINADNAGNVNRSDSKPGRPVKPIVFAFTAQEAGRKVVDYYMTWRGKMPKTNHLKGTHRRMGFLDTEFKKVAKTLEQEWKRVSRAEERKPPEGTSSILPRPMLADIPKSDSSPAALEASRLDPDKPLVPAKAELDRRPSVASVQSMQYLGAIRGVPYGNRVQLRVLNPDPKSPSILSQNRDSYIAEEPENDVFNMDAVLHTLPEESSSLPDEKPLPQIVEPDLPTPRPQLTLRTEFPIGDSHNEPSSESSNNSSDNLQTSSPTNKASDGKDDEILIVMVPSKDGAPNTPQALEFTGPWTDRAERHSRVPNRKPITRESPWNGSLVHSQSTIRRWNSTSRRSIFEAGSGSSSSHTTDTEDDSSSSLDEQWKDRPVVPAVVPSYEYLVRSGYLKPQDLSAYASPAMSNMSLPMSFNGGGYYSNPPVPPSNTPYGSPFAASAGSVYNSPYTSSVPNLPSSYPAASPYIQSSWLPSGVGGVPVDASYGGPPSRAPSWHNTPYSSPYVQAGHMPY